MTAKNIIYWSLTGLVGLIFIGSAVNKFIENPETIQMSASIGLNYDTLRILGAVELLSVILFLIPRTGIIGTLLLAAYMGGAVATHLTHDQSIIAPIIIESFLWVVAFLRFPELKNRLVAKGN